MTVKDLIEVLLQCEEPDREIIVRVWESPRTAEDLPLLSNATIREVRIGRGNQVLMDVEQA